MTAKEYLQKKHEWHKKHWNEHDHIDDNWWAKEMEEYHQAKLKLLDIPIVSEKKPMDEDYPLIPMKDIDDEARLIAVRWHENATNLIGDKHKLASDIMNYARRKFSANAR